MKVYAVIGGAIHDGCPDIWENMDETELEKIFSKKERALDYILNGGYFEACSEIFDEDDEDDVVPKFTYNEELNRFEASLPYDDMYVYYIKEMEVEE